MKVIFTFIVLFLIGILNSCYALSESQLGLIHLVSGTPMILRRSIVSVKEKTSIFNKDTVITGPEDRAKIVYNDGTTILIKSDTQIQLFHNNIRIKIGELHFNYTKKGTQFRLKTASSIISILGTRLSVSVNRKGDTRVSLFSGKISIKALSEKKKTIEMEAGYKINVSRNGIFNSNAKLEKESEILWNNFEKSDKEVDVEVEQIDIQGSIKQEFESNGDCTIFTYPEIRNFGTISIYNQPYRLLIDGCGVLNGRNQVYPTGGRGKLTNLDRNEYELSMLINGLVYNYFVEIPEAVNMIEHVVRFNCVQYKIYLPSGSASFDRAEILKRIRVKVIYDGIEQAAVLDAYPQKWNEINAGTNRIFFYCPVECEVFPTIQFEYTGPIKVKKRIIRLQVNPDTEDAIKIFF